MMLCNFVVWSLFFKQKTAYEMRISDWSSDVCSSDLPLHQCHAAAADLRHPHRQHALLRDCAGHGLAGLRRDRRARQVPDARRGDRMMESNDIPVWVAILTAFFVVAGEIGRAHV